MRKKERENMLKQINENLLTINKKLYENRPIIKLLEQMKIMLEYEQLIKGRNK